MLSSFGIRFIISNGLITIFIALLLLTKQLLKNHVSKRIQYKFWFLFLILLAAPFLPIQSINFGSNLGNAAIQTPETGSYSSTAFHTANTSLIDDFSVSVSSGMPSFINTLILAIWVIGIIIMLLFTIHSNMQLKKLMQSALPVQNNNVRRIYDKCRHDLKIGRSIPIYSTAYLETPISVGLFRPGIYIPIHLISDFNERDIRYILLHELQHHKHKDTLANWLMSLAGILYWFHPLVWHSLKMMGSEREIACDTSVLHLLAEDEYTEYGNTLIHFATKTSQINLSPAAGIGGTKKQIHQRIINIASYHTESLWLKIKGILAFILTGALLLGCAPVLSIRAYEHDTYTFVETNVTYEDLELYYEGYEGSFVLYNLNSNSWNIYNEAAGTRRISPYSTYKIYSALFGLESGAITSFASSMNWDGVNYPYAAWNQDQNLDLAMKNSVNWYFQELDKQTGLSNLKKYIKTISYGNEDLSGGLSNFWLESSLKISPIEQVELLSHLYQNTWGFNPGSIHTVKEALLLSSSDGKSLYGKTGTGNIDGKEINGWFIGFVESADDIWFFAANIQGQDLANGTNASRIALSILKDKGIY